jgi:hypothetical protein
LTSTDVGSDVYIMALSRDGLGGVANTTQKVTLLASKVKVATLLEKDLKKG